MEFLLVGLITGLIGGFPFDFGRDGWWKKWLIITLTMAVINSFLAYLATPELIGPFWGVGVVLLTALGLAPNFIWSGIIHEDSWGVDDGLRFGWVVSFFFIVILLLPIIGGVRGCGVFRADDYRAFVADRVEERDWKVDLQPIDTAHIRMVSEEQAEWMANKAFGQAEGSLGSRYRLGKMTIQKVKNELVWIAPLEFQGFSAWQSSDTTPGYVMMSAEDPTHEAKLVTGFKFRYVPSAYFGDDLDRHLYTHGYQFHGTMDYTFEIDDDGHPYYVATIYEPTIGYGGTDVTGVVLVNPETGELTPYSIADVPAWVDRVIPAPTAHTRLRDYGIYVHGWKNSWWNQVDVNIPTEEHGSLYGLNLVWGDDGKAYWFTGMSSSKRSDQSLVGFVLMDSRTGTTREYRLSGSDETGVTQAVNSAISNFKDWEATDPILYNIYGELTWVVPVVSHTGIFQRLALVRASNSGLVLGKDKTEALALYRQLLQKSDNATAPIADVSNQTVQGIVGRLSCPVVEGNTICHFTLDGDNRIFTASPAISPELPILKIGDQVIVGYVETTEPTVPVRAFDIMGFHSRASQKDK